MSVIRGSCFIKNRGSIFKDLDLHLKQFHTNVCIWWDIAVAKKRKFRQARGISTARANQTGFP